MMVLFLSLQQTDGKWITKNHCRKKHEASNFPTRKITNKNCQQKSKMKSYADELVP